MARTAKIVKELKKQKFKVRARNRCRCCGRARGYYPQISNVPHLFPRHGAQGEIPGVVKASW
jgi:small subunit ribosomal protein S14